MTSTTPPLLRFLYEVLDTRMKSVGNVPVVVLADGMHVVSMTPTLAAPWISVGLLGAQIGPDTGGAILQGPPGPLGPRGLQGLIGPIGPPGPLGPPGTSGLSGNTVHYGSGAPSSDIGNAGDFYIDTSAHYIYGPKTTSWPSGVSLVGPQGNTIHYGSGTPSPSLGIAGDTYIDTTAHEFYGPKGSSTWPAGVSLIGPRGPIGVTGSQGSPGSPGASGAPGSPGQRGEQGAQGDRGTTGIRGLTGLTGLTGAAGVSTSFPAPIYTNTTLGLAATTNGEYFSVITGGNISVYENVTGTATLTTTLPTNATYHNVAQLEAAYVPSTVDTIMLLSYAGFGDLRGHVIGLKRVDMEPTFPGYWQSLDGDYWQLTNTILLPEMFGAIADGQLRTWGSAGGTQPVGTDNYLALSNLFAHITGRYHAATDVPTLSTTFGLTAEFGPGSYCCLSGPLNIVGLTHIKGQGSYGASGQGTRILFPAGVSGLAYDVSATGSKYEDIILWAGVYGTFGDAETGWDGVTEAYGIQSAAQLFIARAGASNFITDGFTGTGDASSTHFGIFNYNGRYGIDLNGGDANAGLWDQCTIDGNGVAGIRENSFLGNLHLAHLSEGNGQWSPNQWVPTNRVCSVQEDGKVWWVRNGSNDNPPDIDGAQILRPSTHQWSTWTLASNDATGCGAPIWGQVLNPTDGNIYTVIPGQEALMWTSRPDESPTVWTNNGAPGAGGNQAAWQCIIWKLNWKPYAAGGDYLGLSDDAANIFIDCYSESSDLPNSRPPNFMSETSSMIGGFACGFTLGAVPNQAAQYVNRIYSNNAPYDTPSSITYSYIGGTSSLGDGVFQYFQYNSSDVTWQWQFTNGGGDIALNINSIANPILITGPYTSTTPRFGSDTVGDCISTDTILLGYQGLSERSQLTFSVDGAPPSYGGWGVGAFCINNDTINYMWTGNADGFMPMGWRCTVKTTGGTGAVWRTVLGVDGTMRTVTQLPPANQCATGSRGMVNDTLDPVPGTPVASGGDVTATVWNRGDAWIVDTAPPSKDVFQTIAELEATKIHSNQNTVSVLSYANAGDLSGHVMGLKRIAALVSAQQVTFAPSFAVTIAIGSPAVLTVPVYGFQGGSPPNGYPIKLSTTGALLTGLSPGTIYYVSNSNYRNGYTFSLSTTQALALAGTSDVNTTGTQSGVHTATLPTMVQWANDGQYNIPASASFVAATTSTLPSSVSAGTVYYVLRSLLDAGMLQIAASPGGTPLSFSSSGSGTQTATISGGPGVWTAGDGSLWQLTNTVLKPQMFGAVGNNSNDDYPAFQAIIDYVNQYGLSATIELGNTNYFVSQTLVIGVKLNIRGESGAGGDWQNAASVLRFPKGVDGLQYNCYYNTDGTHTWQQASASKLERFRISVPVADQYAQGTWDGVLHHGITTGGRIIIDNVAIDGFVGDGLHWVYGGDVADIDAVWVNGCGRDGIHIGDGQAESTDVNAGLITRCLVNGNGRYGVLEASFLGNTHIAHEANGNARFSPQCNKTSVVQEAGKAYWISPRPDMYLTTELNEAAAATARPSTSWVWAMATSDATGCYFPEWGQCVYSGTVYTVIPGQEANMWTSQPDTSPAVWSAGGAPGGGLYIIWQLNHNPYQMGCDYCGWDLNGSNVFLNCYSEDRNIPNAAPPDFMSTQSRREGGIGSGFAWGPGVTWGTGGSSVVRSGAWGDGGDTTEAILGGDSGNNSILRFGFNTHGDPDWKLQFVNGGGDVQLQIANVYPQFTLWGHYSGSTSNTGSSGSNDPQPDSVNIPKLVLGFNNWNLLLTASYEAPSSGAYSEGNLVLNSDPQNTRGGGASQGYTAFAHWCITKSTSWSGAVFRNLLAIDPDTHSLSDLPIGGQAPAWAVASGARTTINDAKSPIMGFPAVGGGSATVPVVYDGVLNKWIVGVCPPLVCLIAALPDPTTVPGASAAVTNGSQVYGSTTLGNTLSVTPGSYWLPVKSNGTDWIISG